MQLIPVKLADFHQLSEAEKEAWVNQMVWFAVNQPTFRLITSVTPWQKEWWRRRRSERAQRAPTAWQRHIFQEELRLGEILTGERPLADIHHTLCLKQADGVQGWFYIEETIPQPPLTGVYAETALDHLTPVLSNGQRDPSRPLARLLASYELRGSWDGMAPLMHLLRRGSERLAICLSAREVTAQQLEFHANTWQASLQESTRLASQVRGTAKVQDAATITQAMQAGMKLHQVRLFFLLIDSQKQRLDARTQTLKKELAQYMGLRDLLGRQTAALQMFDPTAKPTGLPDLDHNVLSTGVGRMLAMTGHAPRHTYEGIYMGVGRGGNGVELGLSYLNLWQGQEAQHIMVLGKTGYGKTVFVQAFMRRLLAEGTQCIFIDPQGHSTRLRDSLPPEAIQYVRLQYEQMVLNPLDVVADRFSDQLDYFLFLLELLLNPLGNDGRRPYRFLDNGEIAAVHEALRATYEGHSWQTLLDEPQVTPTLAVFVARLKQVAGGGTLAEELARLYVQGPWAQTFNGTSTLNVRLQGANGRFTPCLIFDVSQLGRNRRPLVDYILLSAIARESRRPPKAGQARVQRLVAVDEMRYTTSGSPHMVSWLADQIATSRTFKVAYCLMDQNPRTFMGLSGDANLQAMVDEAQMTARLHMVGNIRNVVAFHLESHDAKLLKSFYPDLTDAQIAGLSEAQIGQALFKRGETAQWLDVKLLPSEAKAFIGS